MSIQPVQAVVRAFDILRIIASHTQGVGTSEIAREAGLHKSTVSRLLVTLEHIGAIERLPNSSAVQVSPTFTAELVRQATPKTLIALARPFLIELSNATGEDAGLVIPDGDQAAYIDQVSGNQVVQVRDWTGSRFPLHTVSAGKLFLAHRPADQQEAYLRQPLAAYTKNTMIDPTELRQSLEQIRQSGVSWIFNEFASDLTAAAAPIFNRQGEMIAALSLYGPSYRFPPPNKQAEITALIKSTCQAFSAQL